MLPRNTTMICGVRVLEWSTPIKKKHVVEQDKLLARREGMNEHTTRARCLGIDWQWNTSQFWLAHPTVCVTNACDHTKLWTVKPYSLPYSMSHNQHVITHGCPINLNLWGNKLVRNGIPTYIWVRIEINGTLIRTFDLANVIVSVK